MSRPITFITGIYGSGKTTLALRSVAESCEAAAAQATRAETSEERTAARAGALRYVDYDEVHDYAGPTVIDPESYLGGLAPGDVVDAIPFNARGWADFLKWADGRDDVRIIVAFCRHDEWLARVGERADEAQWCQFWVDAFGLLPESVEWADTGRMRGTASRWSAAERVGLARAVRLYITKHPRAGHDAGYQDAPEVDFRGYSDSAASWRTIEPLVDWTNKVVVDAGCNHGFFAHRASEAGAKFVLGLDQSWPALAVARCLSLVGGHGGVSFRRWRAGDSVDLSDVVLCLNAIHHFGAEAEGFIAEARSKAPVGIYEADLEWEAKLKAVYSKVERHESARKGRAIWRCEP